MPNPLPGMSFFSLLAAGSHSSVKNIPAAWKQKKHDLYSHAVFDVIVNPLWSEIFRISPSSPMLRHQIWELLLIHFELTGSTRWISWVGSTSKHKYLGLTRCLWGEEHLWTTLRLTGQVKFGYPTVWYACTLVTSHGKWLKGLVSGHSGT